MSISNIYNIKDGYAVKITRSDGQTYQVKCEDYQSLVEYREEFLAAQAKKRGSNVR